MDQAITQWINSLVGSNALLDSALIMSTKVGVLLLVALVVAQWWQAGDKATQGFFLRIDVITVYAIAVERMTGKEQPLPPLSEQWPAKDRTKTPNASLPTDGLSLSERTGATIF
jgi:hypothetical protein